MKKNIITGGPGCGKTTIINLLKENYEVLDETAREVIKEHGYPNNLQEIIASEQIKNEENKDIDYLDRSLVDIIAYSKHLDQDIPKDLQKNILKAQYGQVFLLQPLPKALYKKDDERKESYEESLILYKKLENAYQDVGFEVLKVPFLSPEKRVEFILKHAGYEIELKLHGHPENIDNLVNLAYYDEQNYFVRKNDYLFRVRKNSSKDTEQYLLTEKKGQGIKRKEKERFLSKDDFEKLKSELPNSYFKKRGIYVLEEFPQAKICLDEINSNKYTEIEGASTNQVIKVLGELFNIPFEHKSYTQIYSK